MAAPDTLSGDQFGHMAVFAKNLTKAGLNPSKAAPKTRGTSASANYANMRKTIRRGLSSAAFNADPTGGNLPSSGSLDLSGYMGAPEATTPEATTPGVRTNPASSKPSNSTGGKRKTGKIAGLKAHASKYAGNLAANLRRQTGAA